MRLLSSLSSLFNRSAKPWTVLLTLGFLLGTHPSRVMAAPPETAPADLKQAIAQLDAAANAKKLPELMAFYSPSFKHSDGLNRKTLEQAVTDLWKKYPKLTYRTELKAWQATKAGIQADTVTYIQGTRVSNGQELKLNSTLQARHRFQNQKIVEQEVLSENNQILSGDNPPSVRINLPAQVKVGQEFSFDAIVQEPLENDLLLGAALEETVNTNNYLKTPTLDLELLSSGGIFKVGRAPNAPTSQWISAVLVRHGGMTMVTQRLRVVAR
jgi:hypothetical protein